MTGWSSAGNARSGIEHCDGMHATVAVAVSLDASGSGAHGQGEGNLPPDAVRLEEIASEQVRHAAPGFEERLACERTGSRALTAGQPADADAFHAGVCCRCALCTEELAFCRFLLDALND